MSNTSLISKALENPYQLTDTEKSTVAALIKSYPYFIPSRYADAARQYKQDPSAATLYNTRELYTGNWILLNELLQTENNKKIAEPVSENAAVIETILETVLPVEPALEKIATTEIIKDDSLPIEEPAQEELIQPVYSEDYFRHQGVQVSDEIPEDIDKTKQPGKDPKSLMVVMSFAEWLLYYKSKKQKETEEEQEKKALRTMWQKEKLAAAMEEEGDEIPEEVFKMAVDSISKEDGLVTESLAEIHRKQGRHDKAIDMYRKLSLRNPGKKVYFARKIEEILKNK